MNSWNMPMNNMWNPARGPVYSAAPIHGENAAWQFPMGANSEIWLPDADNDFIWWIRTDHVGNKTVQCFDITPHKASEAVDLNDIVNRLTALEERFNAKQNKSNARRNNDNSATVTNAE